MYKIIKDNTIIDVVRLPRFVNFLDNGKVSISDKSTAKGIVGSDTETLYSFAPIPGRQTDIVSIEKIDLEEFNRLRNLLNSGQVLTADKNSLETAKREMITRLSNICKQKITAGFSVVLSDNEKYHFKLTTEDQLNLMLLETQYNAGEELFVYHATNLPCKLYKRDDIHIIINAFRRHLLYHTTYFNAAKQYINALTDIDKVNTFSYGNDISDATVDVTLRQILKNGGGSV